MNALTEMCLVLALGAYDPQAYTALEISVENIRIIAYSPEDKKYITDLLCKDRELIDLSNDGLAGARMVNIYE